MRKPEYNGSRGAFINLRQRAGEGVIMDRARSSLISLVIGFASMLLLVSSPATAQVKPGDFINPQNAYKVKDLVSPGVYWRVQNGMSMKIVPTERIDWPPPYTEATEK